MSSILSIVCPDQVALSIACPDQVALSIVCPDQVVVLSVTRSISEFVFPQTKFRTVQPEINEVIQIQVIKGTIITEAKVILSFLSKDLIFSLISSILVLFIYCFK